MNNVTENLNKEDIEFRRVLGSLEKVDAPDGFGFQVRAKISKAKESNRHNGLWMFLRVAFPAALLLLGGVFVYKNYSSSETVSVVIPEKTTEVVKIEDAFSNLPAANNRVEQVILPDNLSVSTNSVQTKAKLENKVIATNDVVKKESQIKNIYPKTKLKESKELDENDTMFRDSAYTRNKPTIKPKGFNQNTQIENQTPNTGKANLEITEVWKVLGVTAEESEGKWYVKNVQNSSLAERSGLKVNDIIQSFDDRKLLPKDIRVKSLSVKFVTIIRDGKTIEIILKH
jgi:hypothetical protein